MSIVIKIKFSYNYGIFFTHMFDVKVLIEIELENNVDLTNCTFYILLLSKSYYTFQVKNKKYQIPT